MNADGPLGLLLDLAFIGCGIALLVLLILQFRRTGRGPDGE